MEQLKCPSCNHTGEPELAPSKQHIGAYCKQCGAWLKWMPQGDPKFYFGKYSGTLIKDCEDLAYLKWFKENIRQKGYSLRIAVDNRISELEFKLK